MIGREHIIEVAYLIATGLFILSLKWMSSPTTARRGVWAGELGMLLAIVGTLFHHGDRRLQGHRRRAHPGLDHRRQAGHGADDRRAPANGA